MIYVINILCVIFKELFYLFIRVPVLPEYQQVFFEYYEK